MNTKTYRTYRLHDHLSFCRIDGRYIFLDTANDRYFRLSHPLEQALHAYLDGAEVPAGDVERLVDQAILTAAPAASANMYPGITAATGSALERFDGSIARRAGPIMETLLVVGWMQLQLKYRRLGTILDTTTAFRTRRSAPTLREDLQKLADTALLFLTARKFVPIETCCLLDSLSLVSFLARRNLTANIVFGVTDNPFSAHCWVQAGDLILNDALGNTKGYSTIRVI